MREFPSFPEFPEISGIRWNLGEFGEVLGHSGNVGETQFSGIQFVWRLIRIQWEFLGDFSGGRPGFREKLGFGVVIANREVT